MNICGKGNFPECQFFTTGGCVSPFNCIYKIKQDFNTRATSNAMEISRNAEITRLTAENAELRHRAERAERALDKACKDIEQLMDCCRWAADGGVITIKEYTPEKATPQAYIDRAEKELTEEKKDD